MTHIDPDPTAPNLFDRVLTDDELEDITAAEEISSAVTFSTQSFDVAGLVLRLDRGSMLVPTYGKDDARIDTDGFQRGFVWTKAQMDRFIESLLLGFPIPGIFLVKQTASNRLLVLDGQQRLLTLQRFYEGIHAKKEFSLKNVSEQFKGLTYKTLGDSLQFRLDDSYLHATIVTTDGSAEMNEAIYQIFERLNSGGTQLTAHEIRVALSAGPIIELLERLNSNESWRGLYGPRSARLRDQELTLRIIALFTNADKYARPLKTFLNSFASTVRQPTDTVVAASKLFEQAAEVLLPLGPSALRNQGASQINAARTEAIFVGAMRAIADGRLTTNLQLAIDALDKDAEFVTATTRSTADKDFVLLRLDKAAKAFSA
ncbi:DUF262 domain-containing protein [Mycetocola manganoxydans]|uniref:DUF262 domain-containing protein n=1 Tax=Mycetocola manganoxydans TaxID=699879 RepID=A0A3L6ZMD9_9MICO|nr:DUF262 domain-containing protein [Mycetocola manganoxydans]RLP69057.1 DUF262 domain-containing protein [Mycetocola manganoxydans]GHD51715.1 hypothetical protein GCM10008097_26860 [Mycetocola manganoxydans]